MGGFFIVNPAYRELCGLATDMGQPDLVYKFMHLANYNATWNSRKGEQPSGKSIWQNFANFCNGNGPGKGGHFLWSEMTAKKLCPFLCATPY